MALALAYLMLYWSAFAVYDEAMWLFAGPHGSLPSVAVYTMRLLRKDINRS